MKNILVVNVNWLGDVVFSTPVFRALKENNKNAKITCLAVPRVVELLECVEHVDDIIVYDEKGKHWSPWSKLLLIHHLKKRKFDAVYLLHGSKTRAILTALAGIPKRIGYVSNRRSKYLTRAVELPSLDIHRSDYYLNIIESDQQRVRDRSTHLQVSEQSVKEVKELLSKYSIDQNDYCVVLNPGGNWDLKRWPIENYKKLLTMILDEENVKVLLTGSSKDQELNQNIASHSERVFNVAGKTSIKQLIALLQRADVMISGDSGPSHIANSVGTPVIALFGPTRPEITGQRGNGPVTTLQYNVGCNLSACYHLNCTDNICMRAITVEKVFSAYRNFRN